MGGCSIRDKATGVAAYRLLGIRRAKWRLFSMNKIDNSALDSFILLQGVPKSAVWSPRAASASVREWEASPVRESSAAAAAAAAASHLAPLPPACWVWGDFAPNPAASIRCLKLGDLWRWQPAANDYSRNSINELPSTTGRDVLVVGDTDISKFQCMGETDLGVCNFPQSSAVSNISHAVKPHKFVSVHESLGLSVSVVTQFISPRMRYWTLHSVVQIPHK